MGVVHDRIPDYDVLVDDGRVVTLVGPPGRIRHELDFHNGGDQRAILRRATLQSPDLERATGRAVGVVMPTVVLQPGHARRVPIGVLVPSHTPPGRYLGQLTIGAQSLDVEVHVVDEYRLQVAPTALVLENRAGDRATRQIVCTNLGNVPLIVGEIGAVVLDDELTTCRSLRAVTAAWPEEGGEHDAVDRFVDLYVKEGWRKVVEHSGVLRVHTAGGPREIAPGTTELIDLEITLPDRLEPRTRYTGIAPLYTTDLTFRIVPVRGQTEEVGRPVPGTKKATTTSPAPKTSARARKSAS